VLSLHHVITHHFFFAFSAARASFLCRGNPEKDGHKERRNEGLQIIALNILFFVISVLLRVSVYVAAEIIPAIKPPRSAK
jgi:hypothetical protein